MESAPILAIDSLAPARLVLTNLRLRRMELPLLPMVSPGSRLVAHATCKPFTASQAVQVAQLVDYNNVLSGFDAGALRLAGHGNEMDRQDRPPVQFAVVFAQHHQFLVPQRPDRNNHPATVFELVNQRLWHLPRRAGDNDGVERRGLGPAFVAVTRARVDIGVTEPFEAGGGLVGQVLDDFDGIDLRGPFGEHGRLVTGAGANFEHAIRRLWLELLGHKGDDISLRDGLAVADGERTVLVRLGTQVPGHKLMARHL